MMVVVCEQVLSLNLMIILNMTDIFARHTIISMTVSAAMLATSTVSGLWPSLYAALRVGLCVVCRMGKFGL